MVLRLLHEHHVRMGVHVDEPRTHRVVRGVNHPAGLHRRGIPPDYRQRVAGNADAAPEPGLPRAVDDAPVSDQYVEHTGSPFILHRSRLKAIPENRPKCTHNPQ